MNALIAFFTLSLSSEALPMLDPTAGIDFLESYGSTSSVCPFHTFANA